MDVKQKQEISGKATQWVAENQSSQRQLADKAGISPAYMSQICKGIFQYENQGRKASPISDEVFYKIANAIGYRLEFVPHFNCENYQRVTNACAFTQANHRRFIIDSRDSGQSKTYALETYAQNNQNVLYVKCTSLMKGKDLIQLLMDKLKIHFDRRVSNTEKLAAITTEMLKPGYLIILDEFEGVAPDMFRVLKDIEDATYQKCGLVLCGMGVIQELENASKRQKKLGPQLWRRFRTNKLTLGMFRKQYAMDGMAEHGITNGPVVKWISDRVLDFGMLSEYVKDIHDHLISQGEEVNLENVEALFQPL